ncbi:long-chain fatty acid--CoA ligase [Thauera aromatica]|uniref:acyl-CoA synthetase n=1 Tax=Thauera aromatica TaxID=59405 RepID=UPI001FFCF3F1|nr:long-chain fatty acid--CoA ligase [Thauera aromatica]MCK2088809.1 long-chain fatty acid--CoA ligase [Thauera aromatica]MCK2126593.1 long-chain fatty acid--CoA ligase [Thauera aromatica]
MGLWQWIARHAAATPGKVALRFGGQDLNYAQFAARIERFAAALDATGSGHGKCVAYLGHNRPETLVALFACARLGALFMPMNWRLAGAEHRRLLEDCPPAVLIAESPFADAIDDIRRTLPDATLVALGPLPAGWIGLDSFLARAEGRTTPPAGDDTATPLLICYTSGSTGKPRGVLLSQDALIWNAANSIDLHGLTASDRVLVNLPLFHVGGLNNQTTPALSVGATVVLQPKFDADATFDAIERERITLTVLVPTQIEMMLAHPRWADADLSSLRMISTGSTIVPERLVHALLERGIPLVSIYGATETCPIAACLRPEDVARKPASTGRAARYTRIRLIDGAGHDVPAGVTGEILVQGPNVMSGYWNDPHGTAAAFVDGWFRTGDMGHQDDEGYLYIDGRKKDLIISGGENIYPAEIEAVLAEAPQIAEVTVVGRPHPRWGEIVVAVVVVAEGHELNAAQVLQILEGRIARYKLPKEVVFTDQLPRTALGKIRKDDVRRLVARPSHLEHIQ